MVRALSAVVVVAVLALAGGARDSHARAAAAIRVLFVGNSLTTTNDLPARVAELAAATGRELEVGQVTFDGFSLEDHWNQGAARVAISAGSWDVVIMQQGPSAALASQIDLRLWATRFADEARGAGTRPALLTVWPEAYRQPVLPDVIVSYRLAAQAANAELYPAGGAWQAAWSCNRRLGLYGPDGFHPSRLGSYVAALVIYGRLFKAPLLRPQLIPTGIAPRTARLLQWSAARALGRRLPPARRCGR